MTTQTDTVVDHRNIDDSAIALDGYSPVSYLEKGVAERGRREHSAEHNGVRYFFTDEGQRQRFLANPDRYAPAFGGWCAFGMSVGKRFRSDPTRFKVVDGKLLVFLNDIEVDALELWNKGEDRELMAKAEEEWARYAA
jgi:YHS domain-containing protein